jgi:hypothetical protein
MKRPAAIFGIVCFIVLVIAVGSLLWRMTANSEKFKAIQAATNQRQVHEILGKPDYHWPGDNFPPFVVLDSWKPCSQLDGYLGFPLNGELLVVGYDKTGTVVKQYLYSSP